VANKTPSAIFNPISSSRCRTIIDVTSNRIDIADMLYQNRHSQQGGICSAAVARPFRTQAIKIVERPLDPKATAALARRILQKWRSLSEKLDDYEEGIRIAWKMKTVRERKEILLKCWPQMAHCHRPEFQFLFSSRHVTEDARNLFLYPYINLEDLTTPFNILALLHARGHHPPPAFAFFDLQHLHYAQSARMVERRQSVAQHVMFLQQRFDTETYGICARTSRCPNPCDMIDMVRCEMGVAIATEGFLVLKYQERLLDFLCDWVKMMLFDPDLPPRTGMCRQLPPPPPSADDNPWIRLDTPTFPLSGDIHGSFLERVRKLVSAKLLDLEDHLWSMREIPTYFQQVVTNWALHQEEMSITITNQDRPQRFWERTFTTLLSQTYWSILFWRLIEQEVTAIMELRSGYGPNEISPERFLPAEYEKALDRFRYLIAKFEDQLIERFEIWAQASPPLLTRPTCSPRMDIVR
jgi:hypothetical protein